MTTSATRTEKFAKGFGKAACLLMLCTLVAFSLRLHWSAVRIEDGGGFILLSKPPIPAFYFAGASLICVIMWFVLAVGFKRTSVSESHQPQSDGI